MTVRCLRFFVFVAAAALLMACGQSESPKSGEGASAHETNDPAAVAEAADAIKGAAADAVKRIEQSDEVFHDAYQKARAEGQGRLDAASDGYNAVDRHHVPIGEKPQTE